MSADLVSRLDLLPPPWEGGRQTPVLRLTGRLDTGSVPAFRVRMRELVGAGTVSLVLDLSEVVSLDSSGLGAVIGGLKLTREAGGDLRIALANKQVLMTLELTSLNRVLLPYRSVEEAARDLYPEPVEITLRDGEPGAYLDAVHGALDRFLAQLVEAPADEWRMLFEMAVAEIAANVIEHAHPPMIGFRLTARAGASSRSSPTRGRAGTARRARRAWSTFSSSAAGA
jgi:anti-sigma B factor antagonist